MAAILGRPLRRGRGTSPANAYVEDQGRRYRVCYMPGSGRVLMVALKCSAGGERMIEPDGRRARQIIAKAGLHSSG
jgi:hypothetical protein